MSIPYNLSIGETTGALTVFVNGDVRVMTNEHPNWDKARAQVSDPGTDLVAFARLFDPVGAVTDYFEPLSERVSVNGGHVFVDGEEVSDDLAGAILRYMDEGNDPLPLVNFMEKVLTNPQEHSRTQLYAWLSKRDFTITDEGNFIAYKGVRRRADADNSNYPYESISTGQATVDGKVYSGAIPNGVGAVVEMPRGSVAHDPDVACHTGLHAGNWRYASGFSQGAVLTVEINPRDVVSVPHDSNSEKIRCCRYVVIDDEATEEYAGTLYGGALDDDGEEEYDDGYCDCDECNDY